MEIITLFFKTITILTSLIMRLKSIKINVYRQKIFYMIEMVIDKF
jgi:hypothetical protein